jgi:integrase/recombinase XerD
MVILIIMAIGGKFCKAKKHCVLNPHTEQHCKHLTPGGIHANLSGIFDEMYTQLTAEGDPQQIRFAKKLQKASTHWLRHSYGSYLANDRKVPLAFIRDELGHANISTTSLYLDTDAKERQRVVRAAFAEE